MEPMIGYYASSGYCVPSTGGRVRGAIEKGGSGPSPIGWFSSGAYCLKPR